MENLKGILLMVVSMAIFMLSDLCVKQVGTELPRGQIFFLLGLGGALFFALLLRRGGQPVFAADFLQPVIILRNLAEIVGMFGLMTAIILIPISSVSAIMQASPLLVTMGAALFLGEAVGWRRWSAIAIGFGGVLIIIRPGLDGFEPNSLFALLGVAGQALRDLATRGAPNSVPAARMGFYGVLSTGLLGLSMMVFGAPPVMPSLPLLPIVVLMVVLGSIAYHLLNLSIRLGDVAVVVPFRYSRIVFGMLGGIVVFAERPDFWTYFGALIIVLTGIYSFLRERRLARLRMPDTAG